MPLTLREKYLRKRLRTKGIPLDAPVRPKNPREPKVVNPNRAAAQRARHAADRLRALDPATHFALTDPALPHAERQAQARAAAVVALDTYHRHEAARLAKEARAAERHAAIALRAFEATRSTDPERIGLLRLRADDTQALATQARAAATQAAAALLPDSLV